MNAMSKYVGLSRLERRLLALSFVVVGSTRLSLWIFPIWPITRTLDRLSQRFRPTYFLRALHYSAPGMGCSRSQSVCAPGNLPHPSIIGEISHRILHRARMYSSKSECAWMNRNDLRHMPGSSAKARSSWVKTAYVRSLPSSKCEFLYLDPG